MLLKKYICLYCRGYFKDIKLSLKYPLQSSIKFGASRSSFSVVNTNCHVWFNYKKNLLLESLWLIYSLSKWLKYLLYGCHNYCECKQFNNAAWRLILWRPIEILLHHWAIGMAPTNETWHSRLVSCKRVVSPRSSQLVNR